MNIPTRRCRSSSPTNSLVLLTAGDPRRRTGGNLYDARMVRAARRAGMRVRVVSVRTAADVVRALPDRRSLVVIDSIAFGPVARSLGALSAARVIALTHMRVRGASARAVLRRADVAVAVSRPLGRELRDLGARRVRVVPPGCDAVAGPCRASARIPRTAARERLQLLCVANWSRAKGVDVLVDACALVPRVRLDLAGDAGDVAPYARALQRRLRRMPHVRWHGTTPPAGLARLYARADVVIVPSRVEGFGIVAAEAIAHGVPVIASDLPPLRATIGRAGALVRPGDVAALARAIDAARDHRTRRRWSAAARVRAPGLWRWRDAERAVVSLLVAEMHALEDGGERMPPRGVTSPKRKRQYEKIKKSELKRGRSAKTAKRIAAATTNKTRRRKGETKSA